MIGAATTSQPAHGGTSRAWLDGYGATHTDSVSQSVTLPVDCTTASLAFWLHIDTRETGSTVSDRLTVALGGTTVATFSNTQAAAGYQQRTVDVSAFAGRPVALTFTGVEDASAQTSFVLDDVALNVSGGTTTPPPAAVDHPHPGQPGVHGQPEQRRRRLAETGHGVVSTVDLPARPADQWVRPGG